MDPVKAALAAVVMRTKPINLLKVTWGKNGVAPLPVIRDKTDR